MFFVGFLKKIVKMLQTDISPNQIALGAAFGLFLGFIPSMLMKCVFFIIIMLFKVNIGSAFITAAIFLAVSGIVDPISDKIGYAVLTSGALNPLWTALYNMPVVPFTKFNNTIVMGSIVTSIILFAPVFIGAKKFLVYYRANYKDKVAKWKIVKLITAADITLRVTK
jgi:uncharacterized protein (TIGR03546 family)